MRRGVGESLRWILDNEKQVRDEILSVLKEEPRDYGMDRTRWRLQDMLRVVRDELDLAIHSISSLHNWLHRLGIRYRKGWAYLTSPDPHEALKLSVIDALLTRVGTQSQQADEQIVVLWMDELTVYRLPSLAAEWGEANGRAPKAHHTPGEDTKLRIAGALNTQTGQVTVRHAQKMGSVQLRAFYRQIRRDYPDAEQIFVIQDCWPVHFLPEVSQTAHELGISLVPLPTYSSWRNPIEKLWRWLKQDVIHMHSWADDWQRFQDEVRAFLAQFRQGSSQVLHYVGLSD